jgi:uncharacterized surface anchored protein
MGKVMLSTVRVLPRRVAIITALVLLAMAWVLGASHLKGASAAEIDGAITAVNITQTQAGINTNMTLNLTWAVPDSAQSGDTFTLTLPDELKSVTTGFDLLAPDGSVVATAHVVGKVVTFTLTSYVDTHNDVHGGAFFAVRWDQSNLPTQGPVTLQFHTSTTVYTDTVTYTGVGTIDRTKPRKSGHWVDLNVHSGADALAWTLNSPSGPFNKVTFHDTIGAGQSLDCATLKLQLGKTLDANGNPATVGTLPAAKIITKTCSTTSLTVAAGPIDADQIVIVRYDVDITDPSLAKYSNSADVTVDGTSYGSVSDTVRVASAGGSGTGTNSPTTSPTVSPTSTSTSSTTSPTVSGTSTSTSSTTSPTVSGTSISTSPGGPTVLPTRLTNSGAVSGLAFTGANVGPMLLVGGLLVGGGLVFAMAGRKPQRERAHRKH